MYKGYDKVSRKQDLSKPLNPIDKYGRQESRFLEFDPIVKKQKDIPYLVDQHLLEKENA